MRKIGVLILAMALVVGTGGLAFGEDLVGKWVSVDSWGTRAGASAHELGEGDTYLPLEKEVFTLTVTDMSPDGRAFHGKWCSPSKCEDVVGAIRSDGTILMADIDGFFEGRLVGKSLELCYTEAAEEFRVVHCRVMERK
jgi:hypothetical protein